MKQVISSILVVLIVCAGIAMGTGCKKRPKPLDGDTKKMIDTLAAKEIRALRPVMDSICDAQMGTYVSQYVDSLVTSRLADMKILKQK